VLAIIAFAVAAIPAFGIVMKDDAVGRAIVTAVWILIGLAWLGHLMRKR
jgi:K+-transporting ATPase A subunit